jgi:threonine dehydratase
VTIRIDRILADAISQADDAIRPHVLETPVEPWPQLSKKLKSEVFVKAENLQRTGSFKLRGATNAVRKAAATGRKVVTASSGNHGIATADALQKLKHEGLIFLPETVAPSKLAAIRELGGDVRLVGHDSVIAERAARQWAAERKDWQYISPYNHPHVIAGQGTIGSELLRQFPAIDFVYVAVGGGGLISGIATAVKSASPSTKIIACSPVNSRVMHESVRAGRILDLESQDTLSDGTAGGVDEDSITLSYCRDLVDEWILVDEGEIARSLCAYIDDNHRLAEGSAAVAFAAMEKHAMAGGAEGAPVRVAVACGANIGWRRLKDAFDAASG